MLFLAHWAALRQRGLSGLQARGCRSYSFSIRFHLNEEAVHEVPQRRLTTPFDQGRQDGAPIRFRGCAESSPQLAQVLPFHPDFWCLLSLTQLGQGLPLFARRGDAVAKSGDLPGP
jgi:hypothetical protein